MLFSAKDFPFSRKTGTEKGTTGEKGQTAVRRTAEILTRASCL